MPLFLPGDDPAELHALTAELTAYFAPEDEADTRSVRELIHAEWNLRRARRMIQALLAHSPHSTPLAQAQAYETHRHHPAFRLEASYQKQYDRAYTAWFRRQLTHCSDDNQEVRAYARRQQQPGASAQ